MTISQFEELGQALPDVITVGTACDNPIDPQHLNRQMSGYLMKPFGMTELAMTVRRILDGEA